MEILPFLTSPMGCDLPITTVLALETVIQQQNQTINNLTNKINKLGSRIEEQEQYSRRTSLRFNNGLSILHKLIYLTTDTF
jgi:translation initiation factor 2B subunit (eIF-2B alpha/beta/delta family)